ncbi:cytochrome aa3 quinol oxidase subunit II [Lentibacillus sp. N15]|uniref:cytochrome aa3 quinol oxidase subunit II n=1 Tax=Lentibacillus songyuanensis TaxID=3136161 RepID=UPI0031BADAC8
MRVTKISMTFILIAILCLLSGCDQIAVFDPKGPVAESQRNLILYSLYFMGGIILVVYVAFTIMVIKYRNHKNRTDKSYDGDMHGNNLIESIWTIIPILIVTALAIPTISILFDLEKPPDAEVKGNSKDPLVVYATSADWKWIFSYPEEGIETVNYLHIPTDRPVEFRLSSTGSMAALWIPRLGGQKYNMAGMETLLYLQADDPGTYVGRNSNFNGEGFAEQTFKVHAEDAATFDDWVEDKQTNAPKLTQKTYDKLIKPGLSDKHTFSSTHLDWVNHGTHPGMDYQINRYRKAYETPLELERKGVKESIKKEEKKVGES